MKPTIWILTAAALALTSMHNPASAASEADEDWPCIQRKVPSLSPAQTWSGPPLDEALGQWRRDGAVARLVPVLAARRTPMEEVNELIESFAEEAGAAKNERLTLLFAGVFQRLNAERNRIMSGIERYARRQRDLSEEIKNTRLQIRQTRNGDRPVRDGTVTTPRRDGLDATPEDITDNVRFASDLDEKLYWDTRIYDERQRALTFVCDSPVIIEQRVFSLARAIQRHLD